MSSERSETGGALGGGMPDLAGLLAQAQQMQQQLAEAQDQLAEQQVSGDAGGGLVHSPRHRSGRAGRPDDLSRRR